MAQKQNPAVPSNNSKKTHLWSLDEQGRIPFTNKTIHSVSQPNLGDLGWHLKLHNETLYFTLDIKALVSCTSVAYRIVLGVLFKSIHIGVFI